MRRTLRRQISDGLKCGAGGDAGVPRFAVVSAHAGRERLVREYLEHAVAIHQSELDPAQLLQQLEQELVEAEGQLEQCEERYQQACKNIDSTMGAGSERFRNIEMEIETVEGNRRQLESELGRSCQVQIGVWNYAGGLAGVAYVQVGLIQPTFAYVGNDAGWGWLAAVLFGVVVTGEAHLAGENMRRSVPGAVRQPRLNWRYFIGGLVDMFVVLVLLCTAVFVPYIADYLVALGHLPSWGADYSLPHPAPIVLALSLVVLAGGAALSFLAHDANSDLAKWFHAEGVVRRRLAALQTQVKERKAQLFTQHDRIVRHHTQAVDAISKQVLALGNRASDANTKDALIDLAVEYWRVRGTLHRLFGKIDENEGRRARSQFDRFEKKVKGAIGQHGLKIVDLEGQRYDHGMAVTPMNLGDFDSDGALMVDQMIEPIVVGRNGLERPGTVMLRRASK